MNKNKWSEKGIPHKGWVCVYVEDLEEPEFVCEMCGQEEIRYVHYMKHEEFPNIKKVGCVCSGNMEDNYSAAKERDKFMKSRSIKRKRWISRSGWKISNNGSRWIKSDGYCVIIKSWGGYYTALIKSDDGSFKKWSNLHYSSI